MCATSDLANHNIAGQAMACVKPPATVFVLPLWPTPLLVLLRYFRKVRTCELLRHTLQSAHNAMVLLDTLGLQ